MNLFIKDQSPEKISVGLHHCPITNGNPTKMTEAAFRSACERLNAIKEKWGGFGFRKHETNLHEEHCKQCGGQCPPELTIITLEDYDMGARKKGICELCGKEKQLRSVFGKQICSICEYIRRAAHNTPGLLVSSLIEANGRDWLAGLLQLSDTPPADVLDRPANVLDLEGDIAAKELEISALNDQISDLKSDLADLAENNINLVKTAKAQAEEIKTLTAAAAVAKDANNDIAGKDEPISEEVERLRECNRNLNQERLELTANIERMADQLLDRGKTINEATEILGAGESQEAASIMAGFSLPDLCRHRMSYLRDIERDLQDAAAEVDTETGSRAILEAPYGYEALVDVYIAAVNQAAHGKGKERHADAEPFEEQEICTITRSEGHGFTRGQAKKKISEAKRLTRDAAINELLGAINYLAADVIVLGEEA